MPPQRKQLQCRHIFTDGHRCGSPALRREDFCYYHHTTRRPMDPGLILAKSRRTPFSLPLPEDRSAIQFSIGEILRRIAGNQIDSRRAALLLYGLQTASANIGRTPPVARDSEQVDDIVHDPALGTLATVARVGETVGAPWSIAQFFKERLDAERAEKGLPPLPDLPGSPEDASDFTPPSLP